MAQEILGQGILKVDFVGDTQGIKAMQQAMKGFSGSTNAMNSAFNNMNTGSQKFVYNMKNTDAAVTGASASVGQFSKDMFFASAAIGGMTTAVVILGKSITDMTFDYDRNMTMVKAVTGATSSEFKELSKNAREVGQETEFGATKAAEGLLVLARMGLNAADSMKVLTPAVKLAQSQQYGLKETTELVVQQLKVFGKDTAEAAKFSNVLAATASKSAADMEKLSLSLSFVGPVANAAGRSFEEVNATLGLMFNAGIRASRAGTSLRFAFANLMKPTKRVNEALEAIGVSIDQVNPAANSMNNIFKTLAKATEGVSNKASIFFEIFGKRAAPAMTAVISAVQRNSNAFEEMQDKITGTNEATRQFEVQMESFSGTTLKLRSSLQEVALGLGDAMLPMLKAVVDSLQGLTDWFKNLSPAIKEFVVVVGTAVAISGTLLTGLTALGWALGIIGKALFGVTAGFARAIESQRKMITVTTGSVTAERQLASAIMNTASQQMKLNLQKQIGAKAFARDMMTTAQAAAMQQKYARSQAAAYIWSVRRTGAAYGLSKAEVAEAIATFKASLAQNGLSLAYKKSIVQVGFFKGAMMALQTGVKGLWVAIGGLTGALTLGLGIAIPMIVTALGHFKAKAREAADEQKRMVEAVIPLRDRLMELRTAIDVNSEARFNARKKMKELNKAVAEGKASKEDLIKIEKEHNELLKVSKKLGDDEQTVIENLIKSNWRLSAGYDIVNQKMRINLALLKELKGLDVDVEQLEFEEYLSTLDGTTAKLFAINDALESVEDRMRKGVLKTSEYDMKMEALQLTLERTEKLFGEGIGVADDVVEAAKAVTSLESDMESLTKTTIELNERKKSLLKLLKQYREAQEDSGTDKEAAGLKGVGKAADQAARKIQNLINAMKRMKESLDALAKRRVKETQLLGLGEFDAKVEKEKIKVAKEIFAIRQKVIKQTEKLSALESSKTPVSPADVGEAREALESLQDQLEQTTSALEAASAVKISFWTVEEEKKLDRALKVLVVQNKQAALEIENFWGENVQAQIDMKKLANSEANRLLQESIEDEKAKIAKELDLHKIYYESLDEEELDRLVTIGVVSKARVDILKKSDKKILANSKRTAKELDNIRLDGLMKQNELAEEHLQNESNNQANLLNLKISSKGSEIEAAREAGQQETLQFAKMINDKKKLEKELLDYRLDQFKNYSSSISGLVEKIGLAIDTSLDFENFQKNISDLTSSVSNLVSSIQNEDYVSTFMAAFSTALSFFETMDDLIETRSEKDARHAKEAREADKREQEERARRNEEIAAAAKRRSEELTKSALELVSVQREQIKNYLSLEQATIDLEKVFKDMVTTVLSLGASQEDLEGNLEEAATPLKGFAQQVGLESGGTSQSDFIDKAVVDLALATKNAGMAYDKWSAIKKTTFTFDDDAEFASILAAFKEEGMIQVDALKATAERLPIVKAEAEAEFESQKAIDQKEAFDRWSDLDIIELGAEKQLEYAQSPDYLTTFVDEWGDKIDGLVASGGKLNPEFPGSVMMTSPEEVADYLGLNLETLTSSQEDLISAIMTWLAAQDADQYRKYFEEPLSSATEDTETADILRGLLDFYKGEYVKGSFLENVDIGDFTTLIDDIFEEALKGAKTKGDVESAFAEKRESMQFIQDSPNLWDQLDILEQIGLRDYLLDFESEADAIAAAVANIYSPVEKEFENAADKVVEAFDSGAYSFDQATNAINLLEGRISTFPEDLQGGLAKVLRDARIDLLEGVEKKRAQAEGIEADVSGETTQFQEDIADINSEMADVIDNWGSLLDKRQDIIDTFQSESNKLVEDSKKTVSGLQAQKNEILGVFDFSETQSVRSQRFKAAAGVEGKIRSEVEKTAEALTKLTEKYEQDLIDIDKSLQELVDLYGTMANVYESFSIKRTAREAEYIEYLKEQIKLARELGAVINSSLDSHFDHLDSSSLATAGESVAASAGDLAGSFPTDAGGATLEDLETGVVNDTGTDASTAVGAVLNQSPEDFDAAYWTALKEGLVDRMQWEKGKEPPFNKLWDFGDSPYPDDSEQFGEKLAASGATKTSDGRAWLGVPGLDRFSPHSIANNLMQMSIQRGVLQKWNSTSNSIIPAATGFSGLVSKPTLFEAGEGGRPEFVNITPINDMAKYESGMAGGGMTNVIIEEHIDLRGAYGIDSPATAERVWSKVWAPARRQAVNRIIDMRGKVQR